MSEDQTNTKTDESPDEVARRLQRHCSAEYERPSMRAILRAVPMLQWRRCWACGHIGLHRDNVRPAVDCHECGSADTRVMTKETKILHRGSELPAKTLTQIIGNVIDRWEMLPSDLRTDPGLAALNEACEHLLANVTGVPCDE